MPIELATDQSHTDDQDPAEVGRCPYCGETGVGFQDADRPSDYCGHDPALVRRAFA